jgi:hypothetical protein
MVACSIRAAACCRKLDQSDEAETIAQDALVIISKTLEPKFDGSIRTHVSETDHGYSRVFGEWRVKNLLVLARVSIEQQDYEQALQILDNARAVSAKYQVSKCTETPPLETSRLRLVSSDDPDDKHISVTMCEVLCESERKEEELSGSSRDDIGDDEGDDDAHPVSLETSHAIKRIADLLARETERKRNKREQLGHGMFGASPKTAEKETEKPIPQERKSLEKITPVSPPQESSTKQQQEDCLSHSSVESWMCIADLLARETERKRNKREHLRHGVFGASQRTAEKETEKPIPHDWKSLEEITPVSPPQESSTKQTQQEDCLSHSPVESSLCISIDDGEEKYSDPPPLSLETKSANDEITASLLREGLPEGTKEEQQNYNKVGELQQVHVDEGQKENFDPISGSQVPKSTIEGTPQPAPQGSLPEPQENDQQANSLPDSSLGVKKDKNLDTQPLHLVSPPRDVPGPSQQENVDESFDTISCALVEGSAVEMLSHPLREETRPERKKGKHQMHFTLLEETKEQEKKDEFDTQPLSLVVGSSVRATSQPLPRKSSPERTEEGHNMLNSLRRVIEDEELVREASDSQLLSPVVGRAVEVTPPPLRGESSQERKKFEQRVHLILGVSPRVAADDGKKEVFDPKAQSEATRRAVELSASFLRREVSPERQTKKQWEEEFDRQILQILSVVTA